MKTIFKDISNRLDLVASLRWVDKDKGQMNFERPPILFPAALITLGVAQAQNLNRTLQAGQLQVRIRLCFNYGGNTSSITPQADRDQSLEYYDVLDEVVSQLQGFSTGEFNALERRSQQPIPRPDTHTVEEIIFTADFRESITP